MSNDQALTEARKRWGPCGQAVVSRTGLRLVGYRHFPEDWELQVEGAGWTWEEAFSAVAAAPLINQGEINAI